MHLHIIRFGRTAHFANSSTNYCILFAHGVSYCIGIFHWMPEPSNVVSFKTTNLFVLSSTPQLAPNTLNKWHQWFLFSLVWQRGKLIKSKFAFRHISGIFESLVTVGKMFCRNIPGRPNWENPTTGHAICASLSLLRSDRSHHTTVLWTHSSSSVLYRHLPKGSLALHW